MATQTDLNGTVEVPVSAVVDAAAAFYGLERLLSIAIGNQDLPTELSRAIYRTGEELLVAAGLGEMCGPDGDEWYSPGREDDTELDRMLKVREREFVSSRLEALAGAFASAARSYLAAVA